MSAKRFDWASAGAITDSSALALEEVDGRLTWGQLSAAADNWVAHLADIPAHRRVATLSANSVAVVALTAGLPRAGVVGAPLNTRLSVVELQEQLRQLAPACLITEPQWAHSLGLPGVPVAGGLVRCALPDPWAVESDGVAARIATSGSTGPSRWVALHDSHFLAAARAHAMTHGASPSDRWLLTLPLFHVGGVAMLWRAAVSGGSVVVHPSFEAKAVAQRLASGDVTHLSVVPTTLQRLLTTGIPRGHGLKLVLVGGGPMGSKLLHQAREAGLPVVQTYGLTEATSQVTAERVGDADGLSAGPPLVGVSLRVVGETGEALAPETLGRVEVAGPTVTADGWLDTGDFGHLDDRGRLVVSGRRADRIVSGGENISPAEVEQVITACPGVEECVVLPTTDETWGQVPLAAYVGQVVPAVLESWCRVRLAGFKVPKRFHQLEALPRNAMGKINRRALATLLGLVG